MMIPTPVGTLQCSVSKYRTYIKIQFKCATRYQAMTIIPIKFVPFLLTFYYNGEFTESVHSLIWKHLNNHPKNAEIPKTVHYPKNTYIIAKTNTLLFICMLFKFKLKWFVAYRGRCGMRS